MNETLVGAYDAIADQYDQEVHGDEWMRRRLWAHYLSVFQPGEHILDVTCGTGTDAVCLAQHGLRVTALDISPRMIQRVRLKAAEAGVADRIDAHVLDVARLGEWTRTTFDGVISAFAGLNTVPDLAAFADHAASALRPGGHLIVHLLSRSSAWEWVGLVTRGRLGDARRLGQRRERGYTIGGRPVRHRLYLPTEAYQAAFAPRFHLHRAYSLGALRPPHTLRHVPGWLAAGLGWLERGVGAYRPFLNWGRFFVLDLVKR